MKLHVLGSESKGNCYLLTSNSGQTLIMEAGVRMDEVKKALNFDLSGVVGCLCTHQHGDHFRYADRYAKAGIDIYASAETLWGMNFIHRINVVYRHSIPGSSYAAHIGEFTVLAFPVPHGVPCIGFLISHPESGKILFVTDAAYIPHKFTGLKHILIEANYSDEAMVNVRAVGHHMALDTALNFIRDNDPHKLRNVVLLHLSASNSDEKEFIKQVKQVAPHAEVTVADKGVVVDLSRNPF